MAKFIVSRETWLRGKGPGRLLTSEGTRCCLGFVGKQCGLSDEHLRDRATPSDNSKTLDAWPAWLLDKDIYDSSACRLAMGINDDPRIDDAEREERLKAIFKKHGDELEFQP